MAQAASSLWSGIKSVGGAIGKGVGSLFGGGKGGADIASGLSGVTGQAMSGSPGATLPALSQAVGPIADVAGKGFGAAGGGAIDSLIRGGGDALADIGPSSASWVSPVRDALSSLGQTAPASGGGALDGILGIAKNVAPAAILGATFARGQRPAPGVNDIKEFLNRGPTQQQQDAEILNRGAQEAMQGNLPGGATMTINSALRSAEAAIRQRYASLGLSGSTMEAQDLANAQLRAVQTQFQVGQQMATTGLSLANQLAGFGERMNAQQLSIYEKILNAETAQGTQMGDALSRFVGLLPKAA